MLAPKPGVSYESVMKKAKKHCTGASPASPSIVKHNKFEPFGIHPRNQRIPPIRCQEPRLGTTLPHAPGDRMTWVYTNSLKTYRPPRAVDREFVYIYIYIYIYIYKKWSQRDHKNHQKSTQSPPNMPQIPPHTHTKITQKSPQRSPKKPKKYPKCDTTKNQR